MKNFLAMTAPWAIIIIVGLALSRCDKDFHLFCRVVVVATSMSPDRRYEAREQRAECDNPGLAPDAFTLYGIAAYNIRRGKYDSNLTIYGRYDDLNLPKLIWKGPNILQITLSENPKQTVETLYTHVIQIEFAAPATLPR